MASGSKFVQITKELVNIQAMSEHTEAEDKIFRPDSWEQTQKVILMNVIQI